MNIAQARKDLFHAVAESLKQFGFSKRGSEENFLRLIDSGEQDFYFIVNKRGSELFVQPRYSITINSIIDIYHQVTTKEKDYFQYSTVLENSLGELIGYMDNNKEEGTGGSFNYVMKDLNDLQILKQVIPLRFQEYVLPYFNQNSSVERVDFLLNRNPTRLVMHHWLNPHRIIMGTIAAKLVGNPAYRELVAIYTDEMKGVAERYSIEFERLLSFFG